MNSFVSRWLRKIFSLKAMYLILGFSVTFVIAAWPEIVSMRHVPSGYVWTPFQSGNYRVGDAYYYWPLAWKTSQGTHLIQSASVKAPPGEYGIQIMNTVAAWVAAVPVLFTEDPRWLYFFSLFGFFSAYFVFGFLIADAFLKNVRASFLVGLLFAWHYDFYRTLSLTALSWPGLQLVWTRFMYFLDYDLVNDRLRFLNTNVTGLVTLIYICTIVRLKEKPSRIAMGMAVLMGVAVAYNYPPQAFIGYEFLAVTAFWALVQRRMAEAKTLGLTLLSTGVLLLATGYSRIYSEAQINSPFVGMIFKSSVLLSPHEILNYVVTNPGMLDILILGSITLGLLYFFTRKSQSLRFWTGVSGICFALNCIACMVYGNPQFIGRLFYRGILVYWSLFLFVVLANAILNARWFAKITWRPVRGLGFILLSVVIMWYPAQGMRAFAERLGEKQYRPHLFSRSQWDLYEWMRLHVPKDEVVVATDWNEIYLIPMTTKANLFFGHWLLNNRPLDVELNRYFAALRFVGLDEKAFRHSLETSCADLNTWLAMDRRSWSNSTFPIVENSVFQSGMIPFGLFYLPYLNEFNGEKICAEGPGIQANVSEELVRRFKAVDFIQELRAGEAKWILVRSNEHYFLDPKTLVSAFSNDYATLYRIR